MSLSNCFLGIRGKPKKTSLTARFPTKKSSFLIQYLNPIWYKSILDTINFASSLPLDYLSFTLPYPIPGTHLYGRVKNKLIVDDWEGNSHHQLIEHKLLYYSNFSEIKLKFAIIKGLIQFNLKKHLGRYGNKLLIEPLKVLTDYIFKLLK